MSEQPPNPSDPARADGPQGEPDLAANREPHGAGAVVIGEAPAADPHAGGQGAALPNAQEQAPAPHAAGQAAEQPNAQGQASERQHGAVANPALDAAAPAHAIAGAGASQSEASGTEAVARATSGEQDEIPPRDPSVLELIVTYLLHLILGVIAVGGTLYVFTQLDNALNTVSRTTWVQPQKTKLRSGPAAFGFNPATKQLLHRGPIDDKEKSILVALAEPPDESYERAIDALAFTAFESSRTVLLYTLVLGGLGGLIGVLLRNISNFLGVACFKRNFYFPVWWPWYFLRPILAFLTGVVLVILIKSDLLTSPQSNGSGGLWFVGLAVLAGFGVDDFLGRLRVLSKTVFPPEEPKASAEAKVTTTTDKKPKDQQKPGVAGSASANGATAPAGRAGPAERAPASNGHQS